MNEISKDFAVAGGATIRDWRREARYPQVEVAKGARITQASLSNYETGKRVIPLDSFVSICHALGARPTQILAEAMARGNAGLA